MLKDGGEGVVDVRLEGKVNRDVSKGLGVVELVAATVTILVEDGCGEEAEASLSPFDVTFADETCLNVVGAKVVVERGRGVAVVDVFVPFTWTTTSV